MRTAPIRGELAARLGLPAQLEVCLGVADSVAGALGLGASRPGDVAYIAGTSTVILATSDRAAYDPQRRYIVTPMAAPDSWGLEMDLLATGSATRWLARLVGVDEVELIERGRARDPLDAPTFLPYLAPGEQGALWDPNLTGADVGSRPAPRCGRPGPRPAHRNPAGEPPLPRDAAPGHRSAGPVYLGGGGGATSAGFAQELADATGRQVVLASDTTDHSALGAAQLAATRQSATGADDRFDHEAAATGRVITPRAETAGTWALLAERHQRALSR